jgi:ribosomal protein L24
MQRIKKDDEVVVVAGKNKGSHGKVLSVIPRPTALSFRA